MDPDDLFSFLAPSGSGSSSTPKPSETKEEKRKRKEAKKNKKAASTSSSKRPANDDDDDSARLSAAAEENEEEEASPTKRVRLAEVDEQDDKSNKVDPMDELDEDDDQPSTSAQVVPEAIQPVVADEFSTEEAREVAPSAGLEAPTTEGAGIKLTHQVSSHFSFVPSVSSFSACNPGCYTLWTYFSDRSGLLLPRRARLI